VSAWALSPCEFETGEAQAGRTGRDGLPCESPARQKQLVEFARANCTSVQEFAERYFTEVIQRHRKNPIQLRRYLQNEIYPAFGSRRLREVTAQDVQRLVFSLCIPSPWGRFIHPI
jgi:Phage integrase, N-terminal SAM-like domain